MKKNIPTIIISILIVSHGVCFEDSEPSSDLPTVDSVDLEKFSGTWYEIARLPVWDEEGCLCTVSKYSLFPDDSLNVLHECLKDGVHGRLVTSTGKGWALDKTNSKLRFDYKWPFWTLNYIIDIGKHYEYALIGHPNRKRLWVFSRCPDLEEAVFKNLVDKAMEFKFPVHKLIKTYQGKKCIYVEPREFLN